MILNIYQTDNRWRAVLYNSAKNHRQIWNHETYGSSLLDLIQQCQQLYPDLKLQRFAYAQYSQSNTYTSGNYETTTT